MTRTKNSGEWGCHLLLTYNWPRLFNTPRGSPLQLLFPSLVLLKSGTPANGWCSFFLPPFDNMAFGWMDELMDALADSTIEQPMNQFNHFIFNAHIIQIQIRPIQQTRIIFPCTVDPIRINPSSLVGAKVPCKSGLILHISTRQKLIFNKPTSGLTPHISPRKKLIFNKLKV